VKNLKLLFVLAPVFGLFGITGCSKSNNNSTPSSKDSVLYSPWITLAAAFSSTDSAYEQTLTANSITQNIIDHGTIISYILDNQGDIVSPQDFGLFPFYSVGSIFLAAGSDFSQVSYRYVIIPGTTAVANSVTTGVVSASARTFSTTELKNMTYAQLSKALNIPASGSNIK
jgi:hypothetical protein